jgi:hypothetical protein
MSDTEAIKEDVQANLENNFINNADAVKKEMGLLNILISSFVDDEYTYDEYCKCRMKFETEACDKVVDINMEEELELTSQDREIIKNRAVRKHMANQETTIYEELLQEEWVKWCVEKSMVLDRKIFYPIFRYANIEMLKHKIKGEVWENKKAYFEGICESKAKSLANTIAENNKDSHEQNIRTQNM